MPVDEEAIFHAARVLSGGEPQRSFLIDACGGDVKALQRLAALLEIYRGSAGTCDTLVKDLLDTDARDLQRPEFPQIECYEVQEQIGEGGFGYVFRAQQTRPLRRQVAIKLLKPGMDSREVLARFEAERQALAVMSHPGIAGVFDAGTTANGRPYFVMELVDGRPITDYCDQASLSLKQRLELFATVCQAVQHAHQRGIIHRDLKPGNVLVAEHDAKAIAKVIDFGIAKAVSQPLGEQSIHTRAMQLIGTPLYMSPEQAEAGALDIDTRSDVYSLGVLLYELLTGATPFDKEKLRAAGDFGMRRIIREDEPPSPSQKISSLSGERVSTAAHHRGLDQRRLSQSLRGELDWIVMKALEKDRDRRYESASALAADVERYLNHEPVEASPPSGWYRVKKYVLKHAALIGTTTTIVLALLIGTGVSVWQAWEATLARNLATTRLQETQDERTRANASYQKARETVKKLLDEVATKDVATIPGMRELYAKLLVEARDSYESLIKIVPDDPEIHADLGELHRIRGEAELAERALQRAVDLAPDNARYNQKLAGMLAVYGGTEDAFVRGVAHATRALKLGGPVTTCRLLRAIANARLGRAAEAYEEIAEVEEIPSLSVADYVSMVQVCRFLKDSQQGKVYAKKAVALDPGDATAWLELGFCCRQNMEFDEGIAAFDESLRLDARVNVMDRSWKLELRGDCYRCKGMSAEALADFREFMHIKPDATHLYAACASCELHLGNYKAALADIERSLEVNPDDKSCLAAISPKQLMECEDQAVVDRLFELAQVAPVQLAVLHSARADVRIAQGDADGALADVLRAAELNPAYLRVETAFSTSAVNLLAKRGGKYRDAAQPIIDRYEQHLTSECQRLEAEFEQSLDTIGPANATTRDVLLKLRNLRKQYVIVCMDRYRWAEFEPLELKDLERCRSVWGDEDFNTLDAMLDLCTTYAYLGKYAEAEAQELAAIEIQRRTLGEENRMTLHTMSNYGQGLLEQKKFTEAEPHVARVFELCQRVLGETNHYTLKNASRLATAYYEQGKYDQAEEIALTHLDICRKKLGDESSYTIGFIADLARLYELQGAFDKMEPYARDLHEMQQRRKPDEFDAFGSKSTLGACLLGQQRLSEAEPLLLEGQAGMQARAKRAWWSAAALEKGAGRLVKLHEAKNQPEEAARWLKEAGAAKASWPPPLDPGKP